MLGDPHSGSKIWKAPDREICKPGENRGKVMAHWDLQPTAACHDRGEIAATFGPACGAADVQPDSFDPRATGRMEFSAKD